MSVYRQHNYKEVLHTHVQISDNLTVKRSYIDKISDTGLVTFKDGTTYQAGLTWLVKERLLLS